MKDKDQKNLISSLQDAFPNIVYFVDALGWIEFGRDDDSPLTSFIRALNAGGMIWEGKDEYQTLDDAFQDLEASLGEWMQEQGLEP